MLKKLKRVLGEVVKKIKNFFSKKENKNIILGDGTYNIKFTSLEDDNFVTTNSPA